MGYGLCQRKHAKIFLLSVACILTAALLVFRLRRPPEITIEVVSGPRSIAGVSPDDSGKPSGEVSDSAGEDGPAEAVHGEEPSGGGAEAAGPVGLAIVEQPTPLIFVHVAGSVAKPGLYGLEPGSRVHHAVEAAGGMSKDADTDSVNIALPLEDGQQVFIPARTEAGTGGSPQAAPVRIVVQEENDRQALIPPEKTVDVEGRIDVTADSPEVVQSGVEGEAASVVDINTAGLAELDGLPGIGPSLAQRIIDYRSSNGPFKKPEDILEVSGIGTSKYEALKSLIVTR